MAGLRVLVVDDRDRWREILCEYFRRLDPETGAGSGAIVEAVGTEAQAMARFDARAYDLTVVDLSLLGGAEDSGQIDERGFELLKVTRSSPVQRRCAVIVVTSYPTSDRLHRALQDFGVKRVVDKNEFDSEDEELLQTARSAILEARARGAAGGGRDSHHCLTLSYDSQGWTASEFRGPSSLGRDQIHPAVPFDTDNLVRRADNINLLLLLGANHTDWRKEMADIGDHLFQTVASAPKLYDKWASARALARDPPDLWLRFRGPSTGLGVPFDLMREGSTYFCLRSILTREIDRPGLTQRSRPFSSFVQQLGAEGLPLRILLVAANTDGKIPGVDYEVDLLEEHIGRDLARIGVACETTVLKGGEATHARVKEALRTGRHHIFHYAGHGRYKDDLPQASGLVLHSGAGTRALTANELSLLAGSELQLVYLSCCLGAVNKSRPRADDFTGIYDALASAGVPSVLGYRWIVPDASTPELATTFYSHLWRTLCPGEATLAARREAAMGEWGRDDHTWAAPILLMQGT